MTTIYPIYDLTKNSKPYFMTSTTHQNPVSDLRYIIESLVQTNVKLP